MTAVPYMTNFDLGRSTWHNYIYPINSILPLLKLVHGHKTSVSEKLLVQSKSWWFFMKNICIICHWYNYDWTNKPTVSLVAKKIMLVKWNHKMKNLLVPCKLLISEWWPGSKFEHRPSLNFMTSLSGLHDITHAKLLYIISVIPVVTIRFTTTYTEVERLQSFACGFTRHCHLFRFHVLPVKHSLRLCKPAHKRKKKQDLN